MSSPKSVAEKLGIKKGYRILILGAPSGYSLGALPPDARVLTEPPETADLIQAFVSSMSELKQRLAKVKGSLTPKVSIWVTYPKGTSKTKTDLNRDVNASTPRRRVSRRWPYSQLTRRGLLCG